MEEYLYIVIWKGETIPWRAVDRGIFTERRLAENYIECQKAAGETWTYAILAGPITSPESMAEAEARLGDFNAVNVPKGSVADVAPGFATA